MKRRSKKSPAGITKLEEKHSRRTCLRRRVLPLEREGELKPDLRHRRRSARWRSERQMLLSSSPPPSEPAQDHNRGALERKKEVWKRKNRRRKALMVFLQWK